MAKKMCQADIPAREFIRDVPAIVIDRMLGAKRRTPQNHNRIQVDFTECALAKHYPSWEQFFAQIAANRFRSKRYGTPLHEAANPPRTHAPPPAVPAPWDDGPSAASVRRDYGTKD